MKLNKQNGLRAMIIAVVGLLVVMVAFIFHERPSQQEALLAAAPAELAIPADPQQLGAWCIARKAQGTASLSSRAKNWLTDCIAIFGSPAPSPSVTSSPSPTPSPTVTPSPTTTPSPSPTPSSTGDTTPPSVPIGFFATAKSPTILSIVWTASTDNVGVTGYQFYRNSVLLGITPSPDWLDAGLQPDTVYSYTARAIDAAGNLSTLSGAFLARTPANPPPTPGNNCQAAPGSCGFPDAASTGPTGVLTTLSRTTFSTAGERISDVRIPGCVDVTAPNVTFVNVEFTGADCSVARVASDSTGLQIIDSYISCAGTNGTGVSPSNFSLLRVEITGCENGLNVAGNVTMTDSWIHDLVTANGAHTDGAQFNQGASDILFQHNTIVSPNPGGTSAIIMWDEGDPQNARVTIANNLLAGGTYTLYCGRVGTIDNIRITDNRFGDFEYGYANACDTGEVWSNNVLDSTGAVIGAS